MSKTGGDGTGFRPGDRVLVHSAAGGVGQALVQLARVRNCRVTGVVGAVHKREDVAALGAEAVIDRASEDLWASAESIAPTASTRCSTPTAWPRCAKAIAT